jgi:hypothetical protein
MDHDVNDACMGCHNVKPHPRNLFTEKKADEWLHFVVPPDDIVQTMQQSLETTGVGLPLNPQNGEMFCATCHNPHDFKVGSGNGSQAGTSHKLRTNNICQACHEK